MTRTIACIILSICTRAAIAQSTTPAFEAADVHISAKAPNAYMTTALRGGRYEIRKATMLDLICLAWRLENYKVSGGPGWLDTDRFDIIATASANTTPEALSEMLKGLLIDRFRLGVHDGTKPIPTFFLTEKAKKNMKPGNEEADPGWCQYQSIEPSDPGGVPSDSITCRNATMERFINALRYPASPYLGVGPVLDRTGIEGGWDFSVRWTRRAVLQQAGSEGLTIFDAVDKQLGLKLEQQNAPTPVLVVDHVERKPTENPPNVTERLPPPPARPTEFEVADVKPAGPGGRTYMNISPGGRVELRGVTMENLIRIAWGTDPELINGAPKWFNIDKFDIVANAPVDGAGGAQIDLESVRIMTRSLLAERFKLAVHNAVQPVNVYALVAPKHETKMKKSDGSDRSECKYSPELLPPKTALTNIYSCRNTTMADLAERLRGMAPAYIDHPVVDLTGIETSFDFVLGWTGRERMPNAGLPSQNPGAAADPTGGMTIFEAIYRDLGLKLEEQKHPMPVLVVDRVEEKPTAN